MKVFPYTIISPENKSVLIEKINTPHFYQYLHRHDEWQLTWVESGEGTLIAGNNIHSFTSGDAFLIGACLPHLFKSSPDRPFSGERKGTKALSVFFNPKGSLAGVFSLQELKQASLFLERHKHGFKIPAQYSQHIIDNVKYISYASSSTGPLLGFLHLIEALQLMKNDVIPLCSDTYSVHSDTTEKTRMNNVLDFIVKNYNKQLTLDQVANEAHLSPHAFCRYFKKHTGQTFVAFLNEVRVTKVCKKLVEEREANSICEIAYKVGFNSITHFNKVFKNIMGQTPKTYIDNYNAVRKVS